MLCYVLLGLNAAEVGPMLFHRQERHCLFISKKVEGDVLSTRQGLMRQAKMEKGSYSVDLSSPTLCYHFILYTLFSNVVTQLIKDSGLILDYAGAETGCWAGFATNMEMPKRSSWQNHYRYSRLLLWQDFVCIKPPSLTYQWIWSAFTVMC